MFVCLNPYYTGIHLHETRHPLLKAQFRLNPYYTGIHLHKINAQENIRAGVS